MIKKSCKSCQKVLHWKKIRLKEKVWPCADCGAEHALLDVVLTPENMGYKDKVKSARGVQVKQTEPLVLYLSPSIKGNGWWFLFAGLIAIWFGSSLLIFSFSGIGEAFFLLLLLLFGCHFLYEAIQRLFLGHQIQVDGGQLLLQDQLFGFIPLRKQLWPLSDIDQFLVVGEQEMEGGATISITPYSIWHFSKSKLMNLHYY